MLCKFESKQTGSKIKPLVKTAQIKTKNEKDTKQRREIITINFIRNLMAKKY